MKERLVVIGGDAAGMAAASAARRGRPNVDDLHIVAFERGSVTSYSACGIPYRVAGIVASPDDLVARTPEEFRTDHAIDARIRHEVTGIDLASRTVEVRDLDERRTFTEPFDLLMVGTGARPTRPPLPGIDLDHIHGVQTIEDGERLLRHAKEIGCRKVVVVGAGYIGLEIAEAFVMWGASVTVLDGASEVMASLDPPMGALVREAMVRHGIDVRTGVRVAGFEPGRVLVEDGDPVDADIVVLGIGVTPNGALAGDAGIDLGVRGSVVVDARQATSAEGVFAAGDCSQSIHLISGAPVHVALGTVANRQGKVAGINIGGGDARFPGVLGSAVTKLCGTEIGRTGLHLAEAAAAGLDAVAATIETTTRAGYFPGAEPITMRLVAERASGRLLGGQVVGGAGAAKRIDVVATALTAGFTADQLADTDLSYAPPFSPLWEAVLIAASQVSKLTRT